MTITRLFWERLCDGSTFRSLFEILVGVTEKTSILWRGKRETFVTVVGSTREDRPIFDMAPPPPSVAALYCTIPNWKTFLYFSFHSGKPGNRTPTLISDSVSSLFLLFLCTTVLLTAEKKELTLAEMGALFFLLLLAAVSFSSVTVVAFSAAAAVSAESTVSLAEAVSSADSVSLLD